MPWRVEGTAEAGVGWWMPGAAGLARAGMCPPAEGAGGRRVGRAGSHIAWGRCGSCFTCGSRVAAIPPRVAIRSHASVSALWRATTVCQSAAYEEVGATGCHGSAADTCIVSVKRSSPRRRSALMQNSTSV